MQRGWASVERGSKVLVLKVPSRLPDLLAMGSWLLRLHVITTVLVSTVQACKFTQGRARITSDREGCTTAPSIVITSVRTNSEVS